MTQWTEERTGLAIDHAIDTVIFWPNGPLVDQIRRFVELKGEVRESVAVEPTHL